MALEKVALVTGVSSGIGRATANLLADRGFRVFGTTRSPGQATERLGNVELVRLDVRDAESVSSASEPCWIKLGESMHSSTMLVIR